MASVVIVSVDVAGIVAFGLYASWLAYLRLHEEKRNLLLKRYKRGTPVFEFFQRSYSARALLGTGLILLGFILDLAANIFKNSHAHSAVYVVRAADICGLASFLSGSLLVGRVDRRESSKPHGNDWLT